VIFIPFAAPNTEALNSLVDKPGLSATHAGFPLKLQPSLHRLLKERKSLAFGCDQSTPQTAKGLGLNVSMN
jgi:hypothetical protein